MYHHIATEATGLGAHMPHAPDLAAIEAYLLAATELLARDELTVTIESDMTGWVDIVANAPRSAGVNPTFNPAETDHEDAYWLRARRGDETAAVLAARLIDCAGYYAFVRRGGLWARTPLSLDILVDDPLPSGRLAHTGGLWVAPAFRGIGLSWLLPRFNHCTAVVRWDVSDVTAMVFEGLKRTGIPDQNYGAEQSRLMLDGFFPPTGRAETITSLEYSRNFLVNRARNDAELIWHHRDEQMRDLAPIASQRNDQTTVHSHNIA